MADMRDALRKAGLISEKQARQSTHQKRLHRKEVGDEGLAEEQRHKDDEFRQEQEAKRAKDRALEERKAEEAREAVGKVDLVGLIRDGIVSGAMPGPKQYFFTLPGGQITFIEVNDNGGRRIASGSAAIVRSRGAVRGDYCVVDTKTAEILTKEAPDLVVEWSRG
ncbi:MAG: DUF2058 family protein [Candidatus Eisenbacteria bacterium]